MLRDSFSPRFLMATAWATRTWAPCVQGFWVDFEAEGPAQVSLRFEDDSERRQHLEALTEIAGNARLSQHYLALARDLDVMEAKLPEEVSTPCQVQGSGCRAQGSGLRRSWQHARQQMRCAGVSQAGQSAPTSMNQAQGPRCRSCSAVRGGSGAGHACASLASDATCGTAWATVQTPASLGLGSGRSSQRAVRAGVQGAPGGGQGACGASGGLGTRQPGRNLCERLCQCGLRQRQAAHPRRGVAWPEQGSGAG